MDIRRRWPSGDTTTFWRLYRNWLGSKGEKDIGKLPFTQVVLIKLEGREYLVLYLTEVVRSVLRSVMRVGEHGLKASAEIYFLLHLLVSYLHPANHEVIVLKLLVLAVSCPTSIGSGDFLRSRTFFIPGRKIVLGCTVNHW